MIAKVNAAAALSRNELKDFSKLEGIIRKHLRTFVEVGEALAEIRDRQLYRHLHGSFDEYCKRRWGMAGRHAHRLIASTKTHEELSNLAGPDGVAIPAPQNERQIRDLASLTTERKREVWIEANEVAPAGITGAVVAQIVRTPIPAWQLHIQKLRQHFAQHPIDNLNPQAKAMVARQLEPLVALHASLLA